MASKERPRSWLPLDVDFYAQDSICELGEQFGPAGPTVFLVVLTEAKRHANGGVSVERQGEVSLRYRAVARTAFLGGDEDLARRIIEACIRLDLLECLEDDGTRFRVRLVKWHRWETRDSAGAQRQRRRRQRQTSDDRPMGPPVEDEGPR